MNMKFPMNYFVSFVKPAKIYEWRKQYSWPKIIMLLIFTIAFTFLPISLVFMNMTSFNLDMFIPHTMELINEETRAQLEPCTFTNATLNCPSSEQILPNGVIAVLPTSDYTIVGTDNNIQVSEAKNSIIFLDKHLILTDENGIGFEINYPTRFETMNVDSIENVKVGIGELWYSQFRPVAVPVIMLAIVGMLFATVGIYLGFVALIIYMMKFSKMVEIDTYRESFAMVLVACGLPTVLGVGICLFTQDIAVLLTVQSFGMIIFLLAAYFFTKFREPHIKQIDAYEETLRAKKN